MQLSEDRLTIALGQKNFRETLQVRQSCLKRLSGFFYCPYVCLQGTKCQTSQTSGSLFLLLHQRLSKNSVHLSQFLVNIFSNIKVVASCQDFCSYLKDDQFGLLVWLLLSTFFVFIFKST